MGNSYHSKDNGQFISLKEYYDKELENLKDSLCKDIANLNEKIDELFKAYDRATTLSKEANELSTSLAKENMEYRLNEMNNFRKSLEDLTTRYPTKSEFSTFVGGVNKDISSFKETFAELRGKASQQSVTIVYIVQVITIILTIYALTKR